MTAFDAILHDAAPAPRRPRRVGYLAGVVCALALVVGLPTAAVPATSNEAPRVACELAGSGFFDDGCVDVTNVRVEPALHTLEAVK